MSATVCVKFERIGRTHNPPDLQIAVAGDTDLAIQIIRYAKKFCGARGIDIDGEWDPATGQGDGMVLSGFRNAGRFTIQSVVATAVNDD